MIPIKYSAKLGKTPKKKTPKTRKNCRKQTKKYEKGLNASGEYIAGYLKFQNFHSDEFAKQKTFEVLKYP